MFLQGKGDVLASKMTTAFCKKLLLWREHFENECLEMVRSLCGFVARKDVCHL